MSNPRTTRAELLAPFARWPWSAKYWLCEGIHRRTITREEAMEAHAIAAEELDRWMGLHARHGANGLRKIHRGRRRQAAA